MPIGTAFHFLLKSDGLIIDPFHIGAVLVLMQARVVGGVNQNSRAVNAKLYLLGAGADYWIDRKVSLVQYKTNQAIAIGRLWLISDKWQWFGMASVNKVQFKWLYKNGYSASCESLFKFK